jgi:hypothetical protein
MASYHKQEAKIIKHLYHGGRYGNMSDAKKDYKSEMQRAKEYE